MAIRVKECFSIILDMGPRQEREFLGEREWFGGGGDTKKTKGIPPSLFITKIWYGHR